ncbi:MAG: DUF1275 domain-containing protein [Clostridiales bacterium]|nr:DUF1275 domain-containing protein [Clostridiales bacterium]
MAIIGVLVAVSIPVFIGQLKKAKAAADKANVRSTHPPFCFVIGAVVGNSLIKFSGEKAILICPILLSAAFVLMLYKEDDVPEENAEQ